jgi:hypothetical protein
MGRRGLLADLDEDLPQDFDANREVHHTALYESLDPSLFLVALWPDAVRRA